MTLAVYASVILLALHIGPTSNRADESLANFTAPAILVHSAKRLANTRRIAPLVAQTVQVRGTDRGAKTSDASRSYRTIPTGLAARSRRPQASHLCCGIWNEPSRTGASGPLVEHRAFGVGSAGRRIAGVDALVRDAGLVRVAVLVGATAEGAHVVETYVTQETIVVESAGEQAVAVDALLVERALVVGGANRETDVVAASVAFVAVVGVSARHWH